MLRCLAACASWIYTMYLHKEYAHVAGTSKIRSLTMRLDQWSLNQSILWCSIHDKPEPIRLLTQALRVPHSQYSLWQHSMTCLICRCHAKNGMLCMAHVMCHTGLTYHRPSDTTWHLLIGSRGKQAILHLIACSSTVCAALRFHALWPCRIQLARIRMEHSMAAVNSSVCALQQKPVDRMVSTSNLPDSGSLLLILDSRVILWHACRLFYLCPLIFCSAVTKTLPTLAAHAWYELQSCLLLRAGGCM